jgi:hypothetical protein
MGHNDWNVPTPDDLFVTALSADGAPRWERTGTAKWGRGLAGRDADLAIVTEVSGKLDFEGVRAHAHETAVLVAKLTSAGAFSWGRVLSSPSFTRGHDVAVGPDGGVITALGLFLGAKTGPLAVRVAGGEDAVIVKHDASGEVAWVKTFDWPGYDEALALAPTGDGDLMIAGTRWKLPETSLAALGTGPCRGWVARLRPDGQLRWSVEIGDAPGRVSLRRLATAADGTTFVTGLVSGPNRLGEHPIAKDTKERTFVAALDGRGAVRWARLRDAVEALAVDSAGRAIAVGPAGVSIETEGGSSPIVGFPAGTGITDAAIDGAGHLYVAGTARPGATIGEATLGAPLKIRRLTSKLKPSEVGFVAKLAL